MKVAVVHDWLVESGGAENVLKCILEMFPESDLYSLVDFYSDENRDRHLKGKFAITSFIQKLPFSKRYYRNYIPLMPFAIEQFDMTSYDLVLSSSYAVAKGVITGPDQLHICYCHSPMRYAWDLQFQYLKESNLNTGLKSVFVRFLLHWLRNWDYRSAAGVDFFVANSNFIQRRINKVYRRSSWVLNPPVNLDRFSLNVEKEDYFVTASRLVPYKKVDLIVKAFVKMPNKRLIVVGDGPDMDKIRRSASSADNIFLKGYCSDSHLEEYIASACAFVFAAEEDFGIVPLEAQACGTPVIAFGKGGALETVVSGKTGVFFKEQSVSAIISGIADFENAKLLDAEYISNHAKEFGEESFKSAFMEFIESRLKEFRSVSL